MTALPAVDPMDLVLASHSSLKVALQYHADDADRCLLMSLTRSFELLDVVVSAHWKAEFSGRDALYLADVPANKRAA